MLRHLPLNGSRPHPFEQRLDVTRERGTVEEGARGALGDEVMAQGRPPRRIAGQLERQLAIARRIRAHQLVETDGVQHARRDPLGKGAPLDGEHRNAGPERLACGRVRVAWPGVEIEVCAGETVEMRL